MAIGTSMKSSCFRKSLPWIKRVQFGLLVAGATSVLAMKIYECFETFMKQETGLIRFLSIHEWKPCISQLKA